MTTKIKDLKNKLSKAVLESFEKELESRIRSFKIKVDSPELNFCVKGVPVRFIPQNDGKTYSPQFDFDEMAKAYGIDLQSLVQEEIDRLMQSSRIQKHIRDALKKGSYVQDIEEVVFYEFQELIAPTVQEVIKEALEQTNGEGKDG